VRKLIDRFKSFIQKNKLFDRESNLLVAVSGGLDSIALINMLNEAGYNFSVAHCNFQLRGEDSNKDAVLVRDTSIELNKPYYSELFPTQSFAESNKLSIQVAARTLRYQWFNSLMVQNEFDYLLTAHHANDQVETVLYNLSKGTGIAGLRGIPLQREAIVRPLLFATREEIENYATSKKLVWREDVSNQSKKYSRNKIRLDVIPELKKINPNIEQTFLNNSTCFSAIEKLLKHQVNEIKNKYLTKAQESTMLSTSWYDEKKGGLALLIELLKPFGFNSFQSQSIGELLSHANKRSGKFFVALEYKLTIDRENLEITKNKDTEDFHHELQIDDRILSTPFARFELSINSKPNDWTSDKNTAFLDADLLEYPLTIRNWKQGDSFQPLGMTSKKKLSDFMIDEKIPLNLKERILLFQSKGEIIWIAGHRIDNRYKITPSTTKVLVIKRIENV
jgi:tRNA(Ile)-lysidine synthase